MFNFQWYECTQKFRKNSEYFSINIFFFKIIGGVTVVGITKSGNQMSEEYSKLVNHFMNDSMFITCHSDIQNIKNIIKEMHNE